MTELYEGLSDSERAAIEDGDDDTPAVTDDQDDLPPEDDDLDDDAPLVDDDAPATDDEVAAAAAAEAAKVAAAAEAALSSDKDDKANTAEHEAKVAKVAADLAALKAEFDDGELTSKEYSDKYDELQKDLRAIERETIKREVEAETLKAQGQKEWQNAQARFFKSKGNERFQSDENLLLALDSQVKKLATGTMANSTGDEILAEARALVAKSFGLPDTAPPKKDDKRPARPGRPEALPNIGGLPAAGTERPQDSKFASLSRLTGEALEEAVSRLSKADQDEWARG